MSNEQKPDAGDVALAGLFLHAALMANLSERGLLPPEEVNELVLAAVRVADKHPRADPIRRVLDAVFPGAKFYEESAKTLRA